MKAKFGTVKSQKSPDKLFATPTNSAACGSAGIIN